MKYLSAIILFLLAPFLSYEQVLDLTPIVYSTGGPTITLSTSAISGFSANQGSASSPLTFTVSGSALTANLVLTVSGGNYEISTDNISYSTTVINLVPSGGTVNSTTIYVRITSSAALGTVTGNIAATSTSATTRNISLSGTVSAITPTLTPSTNSLSAFSNVVGTASSSQFFTITAANLTAGALVTPPAGFEVSTDNNTFQSSVTLSQSGGTLVGQPVSVWARVAAATAIGSYSGNIVISSTGAANKNVAVTATVNSAGGATVAKFNFTKDASGQTAAGWTQFYGNNQSNLSFTDAGSSYTLQTTGANWAGFAGTGYGSNNEGVATGTFGSIFPAAVIAGNYYNVNRTFNTGTPNYGFHIDNLPTGNYTIQIVGSIKSSVNNQVTFPEYRARFGTETAQELHTMNNQDNTGNPNDGTHVISFTGNIVAGQSLVFGVFAPPSLVPGAGCINAVIITKN